MAQQDGESSSEPLLLLEKSGSPCGTTIAKAQTQSGGRPHYLYWITSCLPLGAYCCYQVVFRGIFTSLVLYLKRVRQEDNATAAAIVSAVLGTGFCTSFLGAYLSDGYLGRFWTSVLILLFLMLGCSLLSIITQLQIKTPAFFTFSLYLTGLAYGWFKPSLVALGGDQFHAAEKRNSFFNQLFVAGTIGEVFALLVVIYLENAGHWALGYWICTGSVGVGVLCLLGMNRSTHQKQRENPFKRILQVVVASVRKCNLELPSDPGLLYGSEEGSAVHSHQFRFLDKAAIIPYEDLGAQGKISPWVLCHLKQVEEVKSILRLLPLWAIILCKSTATSQLTSLYVEQGDYMNAMVGSFEVATASMSLFNMIARILFAMAFDMCVRWQTRARQSSMLVRPLSLAMTQLGISFVAATFSIVVAAFVEAARLSAVRASSNLSILWLVPQYALEGVALVCGTVGEADFFYSAASPGIRSLSSSFLVLNRGLGSFLSALLVIFVTAITTADGQAGWIASNLNEGHLNYYYMLLAGIMIIAFLIFLAIALCCSYPVQEEE